MGYFRALLIRLHVVLGLVGGLFFAVIGITGSALAFRPAMEASLYWPAVEKASGADASIEQASARVLGSPVASGKKVREINFREGRAWEFVVHNRDGSGVQSVYVNPSSGVIVSSRDHSASPFESFRRLHAELALGSFGLQITSRLALLLVLQAALGVIVWRLRDFPFHAHALVGLTGGILAALLAYTAWHMLTKPVSRIVPVVTLRGVENKASLDQIVDTARKRRPSGALAAIYFPQVPSQPFQFWFGPRPSDGIVYMDPYGSVLPLLMKNENNIAQDWHQGPAGGTPARLLRFFAGITVATSFLTGLWRYWQAKRFTARDA
jgi:uncharacterized iron-regulated membrane protein